MQPLFLIAEEVRERVQLNWPDAETGVALGDQNKACTVLSNYLDNGEFAMLRFLFDFQRLLASFIILQLVAKKFYISNCR